jgi:hypothetical protein
MVIFQFVFVNVYQAGYNPRKTHLSSFQIPQQKRPQSQLKHGVFFCKATVRMPLSTLVPNIQWVCLSLMPIDSWRIKKRPSWNNGMADFELKFSKSTNSLQIQSLRKPWAFKKPREFHQANVEKNPQRIPWLPHRRAKGGRENHGLKGSSEISLMNSTSSLVG